MLPLLSVLLKNGKTKENHYLSLYVLSSSPLYKTYGPEMRADNGSPLLGYKYKEDLTAEKYTQKCCIQIFESSR